MFAYMFSHERINRKIETLACYCIFLRVSFHLCWLYVVRADTNRDAISILTIKRKPQCNIPFCQFP